MLPRVFYHDYNDGKFRCLVTSEDSPVLGEIVLLRDFSDEFQSECVVVNLTKIAHHTDIFVELDQVGKFEYLVEAKKTLHRPFTFVEWR